MFSKTVRITAALLLCVILFAAASASAEKTILLTFTGDCTLGSEEDTRKREDSFDSVIKQNGYDYCFAHFREMFANDDLTIINLEGVLSDSSADESKRKRYRFRGPTDFVKILTGASIEVAGITNNHIGDYGKQGEASTKEVLKENGIAYLKNYKDYYIYEKDGIRIAFLAVENTTINKFDKYKKTVKMLKNEEKANAVVVCWHTGKEYRGAHESGKYGTDSTAKSMIKYGADLIIMHHPHVLQGIEVFDNRYVFYSLGNFVFGGNDSIREENFLLDKKVSSLYSMVVQVKMTFSNDGNYLGQQAIIYPVYTSSAAPVNNYQPYRVNAEDAVKVRDAIQIDTKFELPEITTDDEGLSRIDLAYLPAFDNVMVPEGEDEGPQGLPEASSPAPTRKTKGN